MKFTVESNLLAAAMARVSEAASRRDIPLLGHTLIRAKPGKIELTATDLALAVRESVPATVDAPGMATVPAAILTGIARKMAAGSEITARLDGDTMLIRGGRAQFKLATLPPEDWADDLMAGELPHRFSIAAPELRRLIVKTEFAICDEETRYFLCGIYLHIADGKLRAVATNGAMLARYDSIDLPPEAQFPAIIVPSRTIGIVRKLLANREDEVSVEISPAKIRIAVGDTSLASKLIDGTFPDYARVIPQHTKELRIAKTEFSSAVARVAVLSPKERPGVKIDIGGNAAVLSTAGEIGSASEELDIAFSDGEESLSIGFNSRFAKDIFDHIEADQASIMVNSPGEAIVFMDGPALFVVMPMRV